MMPSTPPLKRLRTGTVCAIAVLLVAMSSTAAAAPPTRLADGPTITPNYKDADLSQIIQAVSEVTGKNFIIDPRVNAKVTMRSATPMSPAAFYEAFLSVLQVYGYVAVPAGTAIKVGPKPDTRPPPAQGPPYHAIRPYDAYVKHII